MISQTGQGEQGEFGSGNAFRMLLRRYRKLRNLSLKDLENRSGLSSGYIHRLEKGERWNPSISKIFKLSKALEIPNDLLFETILKKTTSAEETTLSQANVFMSLGFSGMLDNEAKALLMRINEFIIMADWNPKSKVRELFELSELIDDFKSMAG